MNVNILPNEYVALFAALFAALLFSKLAFSGFYYFVVQTFAAVSHIFARNLTTSIEMHVSYGPTKSSWIEGFIEHKCGGNLRHFRITKDSKLDITGFKKGKVVEEEEEEEVISCAKQLEPLATNWTVMFWHKRTPITVVRKLSRELRSSWMLEVLTITAYGTTNRQLLVDMINEAKKMAEEKPDKQINFYRAELTYGMWNLTRRMRPRALSSVVLREGVTKEIKADIEDFLENRKWYKDRGIPYRRGYLLFGPPGCGKTSFVKAIAGQIGYNIYELALSDRNLTDKNLNTMLSKFGKKSILLMEDVDAVFSSRPQDEERAEEDDAVSGKLRIRETKSAVTFSGLLNAIDGVASEEDYIVFMTTNYIDKLDAALIRPGRIDMKQLIDYPDNKQIVTFFKKFYPDCDDEIATKFVKAVKDLKCNPSIAQIQGLFLKHKKIPEDNLLDVESLFEMCKDNIDLSRHNIYI